MKILKIPSTKIQIPNKLQWPKFKTNRMAARHRISVWNVLVIVIWNFDIVWDLSIVIWYFNSVLRKANRFYRNQLEADPDVTLPNASHLDLNFNSLYTMDPMDQALRADRSYRIGFVTGRLPGKPEIHGPKLRFVKYPGPLPILRYIGDGRFWKHKR